MRMETLVVLSVVFEKTMASVPQFQKL